MKVRKTWIALAFPVAALAQGGHEHGVASLDVAVEGGTTLLAFSSPADSLVGFEHPPRDAGQRRLIENAVAALREPVDIRVYRNDARCTLVDSHVQRPYPEAEHAAPGDGHEHADHGEEHAEHAEHADFSAEWTYDCGEGAPSRIEVDLFTTFPGIATIHVRSIGPQGQTARQLNPASRVFTP
jgi:hypothetical protein